MSHHVLMDQAEDIRYKTIQINKLEQIIREEIIQLRLWAVQTEAGGWSSHQLEPMQRRADYLELELARLSKGKS